MLRYMIANFALLTVFLFLFNQVFRQYLLNNNYSMRFRLLIGLVHGSFCLPLLLFNFQLDQSTMIDFRHVMIICSAYFGGLPASLLTSLIVIIARGALFGDITSTTLTAITTIAFVGISCGLIMDHVKHFWRSWLLSLTLTVIMINITSVRLFGEITQDSIIYATLICVGGLFSAFLIRFFESSNRLSRELAQSELRFRSLHSLQEAIFQSSTGTAITVSDTDGTITHFNNAAENMLGYRASELIGLQSALIFHDEQEINSYVQELPNKDAEGLKGIKVFSYFAEHGSKDGREWTYIRKDGSKLTVQLMVSPLKLDGYTTGFIGVATDITQRKMMETTMKQLSLIDGLTELANRRFLDETLLASWKKIQDSSNKSFLSFILIDIDHFKAFNDAYGHLAGDDCLRRVADTFKAIARPSDLAARYGGEEFAFILPDTDTIQASIIADRIRLEVEKLQIPHIRSATSSVVTLSLGVTTYTPSSLDDRLPADLIAEADTALYYAKEHGRNRAVSYTYVCNEKATSIH